MKEGGFSSSLKFDYICGIIDMYPFSEVHLYLEARILYLIPNVKNKDEYDDKFRPQERVLQNDVHPIRKISGQCPEAKSILEGL